MTIISGSCPGGLCKTYSDQTEGRPGGCSLDPPGSSDGWMGGGQRAQGRSQWGSWWEGTNPSGTAARWPVPASVSPCEMWSRAHTSQQVILHLPGPLLGGLRSPPGGQPCSRRGLDSGRATVHVPHRQRGQCNGQRRAERALLAPLCSLPGGQKRPPCLGPISAGAGESPDHRQTVPGWPLELSPLDTEQMHEEWTFPAE